MGNTTSEPVKEAPKKPEQTSSEAIKQVAATSAGIGQYMDHVCARIQPLNSKQVTQKGPQLPT